MDAEDNSVEGLQITGFPEFYHYVKGKGEKIVVQGRSVELFSGYLSQKSLLF